MSKSKPKRNFDFINTQYFKQVINIVLNNLFKEDICTVLCISKKLLKHQ